MIIHVSFCTTCRKCGMWDRTKPPLAMTRLFHHVIYEAKNLRFESSINPHSALQGYYKYTIKEEGALQPLLLLITINSFCNMYFYLQTS